MAERSTEDLRPSWCSPTEWRRYLWEIAGQPTSVRVAMAVEHGLPVIPDRLLAL
ncbi:hypothetical protein [Bifidobacterium scardovii]|jgi:hypothetical protein|uniref:hypothetical protein n=1 Tax=Bifidobacterium scardovii TaxID=158787 RepID=UPI000AC2FADA|nr:hypothetical protein [Bifidobacterium scardovii]MBS6948495.1 hypothetical protein [Bifidobacterium scardovii]MDU3737509.1 hypothetical protein [Bifidobacterium scardovii]MDU5610237.1 hypothetical protein [Bifidobacterium scardovii]